MICSLAFSRLNKDAFVGMFFFFWQSWSNDDEKWKSRLRWRVKKCFRWNFWQCCSTVVYCFFLQVVDVVDKRRRRQESGGRVHRFLQAFGPTVFQVHVVCGAFEEVEVALILSRTIELSIIFLWCVLTRVVCFDGSGTESSCFEAFAEAVCVSMLIRWHESMFWASDGGHAPSAFARSLYVILIRKATPHKNKIESCVSIVNECSLAWLRFFERSI